MKKPVYPLLTVLFFSLVTSQLIAQNVGIGTITPMKKLEVADTADVFIRVNSTNDRVAGLDLFTTGGASITDWRIRTSPSGSLLFQRHPTQFAGIGLVTSAIFTNDGRMRFGSGEVPNADFDFYKSGPRTQMWLTASNFAGQPSYNLVSGIIGFSSRHWRMGIESGDFVLQTGMNEFSSDSTEVLHIDTDGNVGIGIDPTTELHVYGEMQMATAGFSTSQKDKIAIRGILEDQAMLGLGWLKNSGGIETLQEGQSSNRSIIDTYEIYYKSQGSHRWFVNQNASLATTPKMILNPNGWLGIGPDAPDSKLHITGGDGVSLSGKGHMQIGSTSSANLVFDTNEILARSNGNPSTLYFQYWGGNLSLCNNDDGRVGIGTSAPQAKVQIMDGGDVSLASGGELVLGSTSVANLGMDGNEIQARNNGSASALFLQLSGGDVLMCANETGQVGIGVTSSANMPSDDYLLAVDGKIISEEVRVELSGNWPDYVFAEDYALTPLSELEKQIESLGHLPGMPSAAIAESEGILLGDTQRLMMEKIEELTLYMIAANKEIEKLKEANASLQSQIESQQK